MLQTSSVNGPFRFSRMESTIELEDVVEAVEAVASSTGGIFEDGGEREEVDPGETTGTTLPEVPPFLRTSGLAMDQVASILPGCRHRSWCFFTLKVKSHSNDF